MGSPAANPKILYRNPRLLRMVFLQLHRQQRADLFCDVVLQAEGEAVPAHCCVLSACSPFFTERLERETPPKGQRVVLELQGLRIGPLRKLVDFLYTSEMAVSPEEAQEVLAAARRLQVSELESLQLEGGKLVRKALGRHLDRGCLQWPSPAAIPEGSPMPPPPPPGVCCLTPHLLAREQRAAVQPPCTKGTGGNSNTSQKETVKGKTAIKSEDKHQMPVDALAVAEFLTAKATKRLAGRGKDRVGSEEAGNLQTEQARPRVQLGVAASQESKKIKLSRPELSSPPLPMPRTTGDHSAPVSSNIARSVRRLWRKKSPPVKDRARGAEGPGRVERLSPPRLPKAPKGRRHSASEPAPIGSLSQEAGQVGRVKLRKVINGGCWEVVQEPSAALPTRAAPSACALAEKGASPPPRCTGPKVAAAPQQAGSPGRLPANAESSSPPEKTRAGEAGSAVALADGGPCQLLRPDQLAEGGRRDNPASPGELEHSWLDLPLAAEAAAGESQDDTAPEGWPAPCPAPKSGSLPLGTAEAQARHPRSAEGHGCPQWIKAEKSSPPGGEGCAASKVRGGTPGFTSRAPLLGSAHGCVPLATSHSSTARVPLPGLTSPQEDSLTASPQWPVLENGGMRLPGPWPSPEAHGLPSWAEAASGAETKPQAQALQHPLACRLPPPLVIVEEDEIDVGGAEELFLGHDCVWPDASPASEDEVELLQREACSRAVTHLHDPVPNTKAPNVWI